MSGRLSTWSAALVIARRDFGAILFSRSFLFFLLGPLFPVLVGAMAGGVGARVQESADTPVLAVALSEADAHRLETARGSLTGFGGMELPDLRILSPGPDDSHRDPQAILRDTTPSVAAVLSGTLEAPVLTGPQPVIERWRGAVSMLTAQATGQGPRAFPAVALAPVARDTAPADKRGLLLTAQGGQTLLFLLTMLLAGMVLSNLVEEKGNKIIEILAAAIPMDAVFFGKLFAMLAISFVGIAVWGLAGGTLFLLAGQAAPDLTAPAVGWPLFLALGIVYFAMAYLLLGSLFLAIGSMATTVREVQTLSMPVTMLQLMVFFLASYAMTQPGSPVELFSVVFPFSSPFAMLARAAQDPAVLPHLAAVAWQALCVLAFVRMGARLFRSRVMKSGPAGARRTGWWRRRQGAKA